MAASRPNQTLADYVTMAISPVLIMALVGSLCFFLVEVLQLGPFAERLKWTLFWFVFAVVLIARISIQIGAARARLYGLAMAVVGFIALQAFVEFPPEHPLAPFRLAVNLGFMTLVWWCANKLTWDCTHINDEVTEAGEGLLEAAGLDPAAEKTALSEHSVETSSAAKSPKKKEEPSLLGWWGRYDRYQEEQRRKPHKPGVWVVYFSLAALPLYGLGQTLIPPDQEARRQYAFWMMVIYVGSGLGLLMTTTFLGLRRYLRQRNLQMPMAMTGMWLSVGGIVIVVLLVAGALLPRPQPEYSIMDLVGSGSANREASKHAVLRDSPGKGEGARSTDRPEHDPKGDPVSGKRGEQQGGSDSAKGGGDKSGKDSGDQKNSTQKNDEPGQKGKDRSDKDSPTGSKQGERTSGSSETKGRTAESRDTKSGDNRSSSPNNPVSRLTSAFESLSTVLKWVVFAVLALAALFFVLRSGLRWLANFTNWAKRLLDALEAWWRSLFGRRTERVAQSVIIEQEYRPPPRPFSSFANPFLDGSAEQQSPAELVRYSFEALEAWARDHGLERPANETPIEFVERLAGEVPPLEGDARRLVALYAHAAYAGAKLSPQCLEPLRQFWEKLEAVAEAPMSA